jgi:phospho-N-acetylmuramoyl-pentapeptide-transferase
MTNISFVLGSLIGAFLITFFLMPYGIRFLQYIKFWKQIRTDWLVWWIALEFAKLHGHKQGTPTMWWVFILFTVIVMIVISYGVVALDPWLKETLGIDIRHSLWNRKETYIVIFTLFSVWFLGLIDDWFNIQWVGKTKWLSAKTKMAGLSLFGLIWAYWFFEKLWYSSIHIPLVGMIDLWWAYIPLFVFIIIASANSVNFTDGLDGLAGGLIVFQYAAYGFITYSKGLFILSAFCCIIVWAMMAFLWFNIHPAQVFMGDVWSLSLGATLWVIAMMTDTLAAFVIMSSIFIFETLSVIIQMASKKFRNGKKIFRIAPFHHHLEAIWWHETTIVMRLWLIGIVLAVAGIALAVGWRV